MALTDELWTVAKDLERDVRVVAVEHKDLAKGAARDGEAAASSFFKARDRVIAGIDGKRFDGRSIPPQWLRLRLKEMAQAISKADREVPDPAYFEKWMIKFDRLERAAPRKSFRAVEVSKKAKHATAIREFVDAMERYNTKVRTHPTLKAPWKAFQKRPHWKAFAAESWASNKVAIKKARGDFAAYANALAAFKARHTITISDLNQIRGHMRAMKASAATNDASFLTLSSAVADFHQINERVGELSSLLAAAAKSESDASEAQKRLAMFQAFASDCTRDLAELKGLDDRLGTQGIDLIYHDMIGASLPSAPSRKLNEAARIRSAYPFGGSATPAPDTERMQREDDRTFEKDVVEPYGSVSRDLMQLLDDQMNIDSRPHLRFLSDLNGDGAVTAPFDGFMTNIEGFRQGMEGASDKVDAAIKAAIRLDGARRSQAQIQAFNDYQNFLETLEEVDGELRRLAISLRAQQSQAAARGLPDELVNNYGGFARYVDKCQATVSQARGRA